MPATQSAPIFYARSGCTDSAKVHAWLNDRGSSFTERDAIANLTQRKR
jgi:arsenate reductase-like glutaredoxin family protein